MRLLTASHLFGEIVAEHGFPSEYDELASTLAAIPVPLRATGPFTSSGHPPTPKRQRRPIGGSKRFAMMPIDQVQLNKDLDKALRDKGWTSQPIAVGATGSSGLTGDFVRSGVFVEVEFGNQASLFRDLFKFQIANRARTGDVGVLVVATQRMAKFFDQGVATFEQAEQLLEYMRIGIQMPIWIVGIEPNSWAEIKQRYDEMYEVASENGVECHPFETVDSWTPEATATDESDLEA